MSPFWIRVTPLWSHGPAHLNCACQVLTVPFLCRFVCLLYCLSCGIAVTFFVCSCVPLLCLPLPCFLGCLVVAVWFCAAVVLFFGLLVAVSLLVWLLLLCSLGFVPFLPARPLSSRTTGVLLVVQWDLPAGVSPWVSGCALQRPECLAGWLCFCLLLGFACHCINSVNLHNAIVFPA